MKGRKLKCLLRFRYLSSNMIRLSDVEVKNDYLGTAGLVLEFEMSVLKIINLYFYRTSSQQIEVPSGPFLISRIGTEK